MALAGGTAAIGLVLGLVWSGHHADQVREAQARSTVNALASFQSVNRIRTGQGPAVELAVDVFNVGALPIAVVTSPSQTRLSYDTPVVTSMSGTQQIAPGTSMPVTARLLLACDSREPIELAVPVQAPDGDVHRLPMQTAQWQSADLFPADLCNQSDDERQPLEANVAGTLLHPTLELRNWTADPMTVTWGSGGQPGLAEFLEKVDLRLTPALPLTLRPERAADPAAEHHHARLPAGRLARRPQRLQQPDAARHRTVRAGRRGMGAGHRRARRRDAARVRLTGQDSRPASTASATSVP